MIDVLAPRRAGVLLHPTSLPGATFGSDAYRFVDFLRDAGFTVWQTLPLGPVDEQGSPYGLRSAHAGDPRFIDIPSLPDHAELPSGLRFDSVCDRPDDAYRSFAATASSQQRALFAAFVRREREWLLPYGLFNVCELAFGGDPWWLWPAGFREPGMRALLRLARSCKARFRGILLQQYLFELQWSALRSYAHRRDVYLFGDMPFYVDRSSVDVWWHRSLFRLRPDGAPEAVAGVPPDYFSADGQRWGNPLYDWRQMARRRYAWWLSRIEGQLRRFDLLRIDHFRALEAYWEIPGDSPTARDGRWRPGCGDALLARLRERLGELPLVAEDLGIINAEVLALRDRYGLPGMVVLQFAFDGSHDNPHLPEHHKKRAVCYTGTHDNDTTLGWFTRLDETTRALVYDRIGNPTAAMPEALIDVAYASRAQLAILPMQDLLELGSEARMNTPGTTSGNWRWRFSWSDVARDLAGRYRERAARYGRVGARLSAS